ncbi:RNA polymerase III subunit GL b [Simochromis diagramma]|uniref:RNA polymerase III subunit GL b n=1 Tax=Simochromis diagramma TaxID=43689 RepID=UPI001A7E87FA|nr:RNA polymerase III subunit GL b [Simochromis diagramma]XP_039886948.1 RNA polymerase III subunit GL b [Simochromis diagramma]XP_039886949.1 RNA polymerase III subunit GL b [Simochromis diagramma]
MAARGRGQRMLSFTMETVKGDAPPPSVQQPTPVFPVMERKPLPLTGGEEAEYLLALKQDFRGAMRSLPCFIQPLVTHRDVERYSDKYNRSEQMDKLLDWAPDWKRFPRELRVHVRKPARDSVSAAVQSPPPPQMKKKGVKDKEEVLLKLESLEKKEEQETSEDEEGETKKKQEEEEAEGEEEYDEEEFEEETDYIMSYFDNGEDFGGDSDDNMDEAIY